MPFFPAAFFFWMFMAFVQPVEARDIYVRLADNPSRVVLASDSPMTLADGANKNFALGKSAVLTRSGSGGVAVEKRKFQLPVQISGSGLLGFNNRKYRGQFLLTREFVLINVLDVEDYIRGVLPAEGVAAWPKEYQKAQAIISRTFGLRQSLNRSARGYDVTDNTSAQMYKGAGVETTATNQAVAETASEVLTYGDSLAFTPFHSDSGGHTANNAQVWSEAIPYLTGVKEPIGYTSPNSNWTAKISASQVETALSKIGSSVGKLKEIRIATLDAGGRTTTLTFTGSARSVSVKSSLFRTTIGPNLLKSTMLTGGGSLSSPLPSSSEISDMNDAVDDSLPHAPVPTSKKTLSKKEETRLTRMTSEGVFTAAELMDMLINPDKRKGYLDIGIQRGTVPARPKKERKKTPPAVLPKKAPPDTSTPALRPDQVIRQEKGYFIFTGKGWGHGLGLSQWGALAMAKAGWTAERILGYYYPGTSVKKFK
jgi:stage II sporulation protein D